MTNPLPFAVSPGTRLLGEIITWTCTGSSIKHLDVINGLRDVNLDEGVARELAPRHAFSRACKKLAQDRIIRQINEDSASIVFQFTAEKKQDDRFTYELETLLTLEKSTGKVTCPKAGLAALAQEELDRCIQARTGGDVTRIVQKLFEQKADLFPIRARGGAYFVPQEHIDFVDRVQKFLSKLNGQMQRFPIPAGTPHGDGSVKDAVANGISGLIADHAAAVELFGDDTRSDTLERAAEKIRLTRHKIAAYSEYLADERDRLERELSAASGKLREKVLQLAAIRESDVVEAAAS